MLKRKLILSKSIKCISHFSHTKTLDTTIIIPKVTISSVTSGDNSKPAFHKRPLPLPLVALSSPEGKVLFREAMTQGGMESFFALSEQFITQSDPAFCSLSSLAMVLNALNFDPKRVWKGSWRWVSEEMLQCESKELCCHSIDKIRQHGMDFNGFESLARCHGVNIDSIRVTPEYANTPHHYDQFKQQIIDVSCNDKAESFMVVNFSRKTLGQTGDGHFSPIGGYHKEKELVLVLDVARFKYPPYWVSIKTLWESMQGKDQFSGKSRGYFNISIATNTAKEPTGSAAAAAAITAESLAITRAQSIAAAIARGEVRESIPPSFLSNITTPAASSASASSSSAVKSSCVAVPLTVSSSSESSTSSCCKADTITTRSTIPPLTSSSSSSCCSSATSSCKPTSNSSVSAHKISMSSNSNLSAIINNNTSSSSSSSSSSRNLYTASRLVINGCCESGNTDYSNNFKNNSNMLSRLMKRSSNITNNTNDNTNKDNTESSITSTTILNNGKIKICTNSDSCSQRRLQSNNNNNNNNNNGYTHDDEGRTVRMCNC